MLRIGDEFVVVIHFSTRADKLCVWNECNTDFKKMTKVFKVYVCLLLNMKREREKEKKKERKRKSDF